MMLESEIIETFKNESVLELKVKQISQDLTDGKYDISKLVENLGFALTSTVVDMRVNGTRFLSSVLSILPKHILSDGQIKFITSFYCDRLKDHHNVYPYIITGILSIVQMKNLPNGCTTQIYLAFFQNLACQSQVKTDREKIYQMLKISTRERKQELIEMKGDFLYGLINAMDGERDPKNLDFIFNFMPEFMKEFPLLHLVEEVFEIFACYFPIDFNPSKTDPASITRDNLASSLCDCLTASPEFADWTICLSLDKLESDLVVAKLDSLELLIRGSSKFSVKSIETHFDVIWDALKSELLPGSDNQEVISKTLRALQSLLQSVSNDAIISKNLQTTVLSSILCHLNDTNHRMFSPAKSIALVCVASDSNYSTEKILNCLILKLKADDCDDDEREKLLAAISEVMVICSSKSCLGVISKDVLESLENELTKLVVSGSHNKSLIESLFNCLGISFQTFNLESRNLIYKSLLNILTDSNLNLDKILFEMAKFYPVEVKERLVENLIKNFDNFELNIKMHLFKYFKSLVVFAELKTIVLNLIISNILNSTNDKEKIVALNAFTLVLDDQINENNLIAELLHNYKIIDTLCNFTKTQSDISVEILDKISLVLSIFIKKLSIEDQKHVLDEYLPRMKMENTADLFLTKGILGFLHVNTSTDKYFDNLIDDLTTLSLKYEDPVLCKACHHLLCSLLNKSEENQKNKKTLRNILDKLKSEIDKENEKAVNVLSWIAKGLTVRGHSDAAETIDTLADLLSHPNLGNAACFAFEIISTEYPELHLPIIQFLYKQKIFQIVLQKISKNLMEFSENHLNAFIFIMNMVPHKVLVINIEKVGPILFKCLEMEQISTILIALAISNKFLLEKDEYFRVHFNYLIPELLKLTKNRNSMKVRISSLKCIEALADYPTYITLPHRVDVIYNLAEALDDKKRLVRNAAVKARNLWFLIGSASSDE